MFKQKFNGWYDQKEVHILKMTTKLKEDMVDHLSRHEFDEAFESYLNRLRYHERLLRFQQFKQYVFDKDEKNEH